MIRSSAFTLALLLGLAAMPRSAGAQAGDTAAEALFKEGAAKLDAGDFAAACPLLERAVAASTSEALGGMLALAECYEKSSRPATAWALYKKVAARAGASGQAPRAAEAESAASRLEPTLPRVRFIAPKDSPPGLRVRYGAEVVPSNVWDVALPIDPGSVRMTFEADGRQPRAVDVEVPATATVTHVAVPVLAPQSSRTPGQGAAPSDKDTGASGLGPIGIAGVVVGSVGGAAAIASLILAVDAKSKWDEAVEADCPAGLPRCTSLDGIDSARTQGDAGTAMFGVGVGLVAVGAGLLIYDLVARPSDDAPKAAPAPAVGFAVVPQAEGAIFFTAARFVAW